MHVGSTESDGLYWHGYIVADRSRTANRERAEAFQPTLDAGRSGATIHQGNVGVSEDCLRVVHEVMERHGRLDILVNNAGVTVDRPMAATTVDDWHQVLRVNLSGAFYLSKPALARMLQRGSGRIIKHLVDRRRDRQHRPGQLGRLQVRPPRAYQVARREAALALDKAGKFEDRTGLTVNAVTPGLIETDMTAALPEKALERIRAAIPLRRMGRPDEVARVARLLAAESAAGAGAFPTSAWRRVTLDLARG